MARRAVGGFCSAWSLGSAASGRSSSAAASKGHKDRTVSAPTLSHGRRQWRDHGRAGARRERRRMTLILLVVATLLVTTSLLCFRKRALRQRRAPRSEEHTSELQSLMRISYAVFCFKKKIHNNIVTHQNNTTL